MVLSFLRWQPCINRAIHGYITQYNTMQQNKHCAQLFPNNTAYFVIKEHNHPINQSPMTQALKPQFIFSKNFQKDRALNIFTFPWTKPMTTHCTITHDFKLCGAPINHLNCSVVPFECNSGFPLFLLNCKEKETKVVIENIAFIHNVCGRPGVAICIASIGGQVVINNCSFGNCSIVCSDNNKCDIIIKNCQFMNSCSGIRALAFDRLVVMNNTFARSGQMVDCFDAKSELDYVPYIQYDAGQTGYVKIAHNKFAIGQTVPIMVSNEKKRAINDAEVDEFERQGWTYLISIMGKRVIQSNDWLNLSPNAPGHAFVKRAPNCAFLSFYNGHI